MRDTIIFEINKHLYGLDLDNIQRIIQVPELTTIPDSHPYIDGMMSYESGVIRVLNMRKICGMQSYEEELKNYFSELKQDHIQWVDSLCDSIQEETEFTKTTDPHVCGLGKWLDTFTSYDDNIVGVFKKLYSEHEKLHKSAIDILETRKTDKEQAFQDCDTKIRGIYRNTVSYMDEFIKHFGSVASSIQKLLIYSNGTRRMGLKVDAIYDIKAIDDSAIRPMDELEVDGSSLILEGVIDIDGKLVNIIKAVDLPKNKAA